MDITRMDRQSKTSVLLTVDTEADLHQGRIIPLDRMVYCRIGGKEYGINLMMDLADRFGAKMSFFVSVFEHRRLGIEPIREICQLIYQRGHEVHLHTHPNWIYDHRFMWGYPLETQIELIQEGKKIIEDCIGVSPIGHRAGGFGADENTLLALKENNIPVDSSYLFGQYCKIPSASFPHNGIKELSGVLEIPVTIFEQFRLGSLHPYRPFDININSLSELLFVLEEAKKAKLPVVNLLMHSFSFVTRSKDRTEIKPCFRDLGKFEKLLEYIAEDEDLEAIGLEEYYLKNIKEQKTSEVSGKVPVSGFVRTAVRASFDPLRGRANQLVASIVYSSAILFIIIIISLLAL